MPVQNILKYVKLPDDKIIVFPRSIKHTEFRSFEPVTAGYCEFSVIDKTVTCWGESESLELSSDRENDSRIATEQFFGPYKEVHARDVN